MRACPAQAASVKPMRIEWSGFANGRNKLLWFNKTLFHDFIRTLQDLEVLRRDADGNIEFDDDLTNIGADARLVLGEEIRHSILSLTINN